MIFTFKDILTPDEILRLRFLNKKILDRIYYFDYVKMINDDRVFSRSLFLECDKNIIIIGAEESWRADGEDFQRLRVDNISDIDNVKEYVKTFFPNTVSRKKELALKCIEMEVRIDRVIWNREHFKYRNQDNYWKREWDNMIVLFLENNKQIILECVTDCLAPCIVLYNYSDLNSYLKKYNELDRLIGNWNPEDTYTADILEYNRCLLE